MTWSQTGGTLKFDATDEVFTASGGSLVARYAVIYNDTSSTDLLVCWSLMDNTPGDITAPDGNTLTVTFSTDGIFQIIST